MSGEAYFVQQATEPELASIVTSSYDAIVGMTAHGVVSSCNPAAARLYGYRPEEIIGQPAEVLVPPELRAEEAAVLRQIMAGERVEPYRTDRACRDGSVLTVSMTISPIVDADGAIVGAATISHRAAGVRDDRDCVGARAHQQRADARDAEDRFQVGVDAERARQRADARDAEDRFQVGTGIGRAEAQSDRERLGAQLQQGQRLEVLGQLAGGVAHDFNNLLAVIVNYAAFVTDELTAAGGHPDVAAAARDVAQIHRAAERATALTHQLLAFARREVIQPRVLDLNHVVADVEELLSRTIGADVMLRTDLAADLWPVLMDPGQLEQVLLNIAVNARDAMAGGGALTIDTANVVVDADPSAASPAGRYVRLRITDTGEGMSADVLDRVFEPFYTTKAEGMGTGLGLATVYGIVTQAGATIAIRSKPGAGTSVRILIPATDQTATPDPEISAGNLARGGETVLVVEDDEALRQVTERIFVRNGYRVISAADGVEAVALARDHDGEISLLVTDVVMPKMLGNEVAERIRHIKPGIEVLYMSGYVQQNLASQSTLDRDVHLVQKPFSAATLVRMAGQILDGRRPGLVPVRPNASATPTGGTPADGPDLPGARA